MTGELTAEIRPDSEKLTADIDASGPYISFAVSHSLLPDRDLPNQHPIDSITGLSEMLINMDNNILIISNEEIYDIINKKEE